jgi:GNAT superfamily N-acetyltransferase
MKHRAKAARGQGFGELLLLDALHRCHALDQLGAVAVVVDAKDDAARAFSERYGFWRFADDAYRLFIPMVTIARL